MSPALKNASLQRCICLEEVPHVPGPQKCFVTEVYLSRGGSTCPRPSKMLRYRGVFVYRRFHMSPTLKNASFYRCICLQEVPHVPGPQKCFVLQVYLSRGGSTCPQPSQMLRYRGVFVYRRFHMSPALKNASFHRCICLEEGPHVPGPQKCFVTEVYLSRGGSTCPRPSKMLRYRGVFVYRRFHMSPALKNASFYRCICLQEVPHVPGPQKCFVLQVYLSRGGSTCP